uniref:beta-1,3-galactosyl-O-glycosyl-glycoprotein beta-1,6-N-acetylglucosaminyltransferase 3-like n=1 Tax=Myxine glutinosa TaxID=7769 RepID=UPI00358F3E82
MYFYYKKYISRLVLVFCLSSLSLVVLHYLGIVITIQNIRQNHLSFYNISAVPGRLNVACNRAAHGDRVAVALGRLLRQRAVPQIAAAFAKLLNQTNGQMDERKRKCDEFVKQRRYLTFPLSEEEGRFPLAFSIVVHHMPGMVERLLRTIYAPQNVYCIHVDLKAPKEFQQAMAHLADCFPNVFLARHPVQVTYASYSRLEADFMCMEDLLESPVPWKYLFNLCGQDFPLKTNLEMVQVLRGLQSRSNIESVTPPAQKFHRWRQHHIISNGQIIKTGTTKSPLPSSLPSIFIGSAYIIASRDLVQHALTDPTARELREWCRDVYSPDELFWATLIRSPGVPGYFPPFRHYDIQDVMALARFVSWSELEGDDLFHGASAYPRCTGVIRRDVCVFGLGDLSWLMTRMQLFANKFDPTVDASVIQCLEEMLREQAILDAMFG